jgi:hypothetical protein
MFISDDETVDSILDSIEDSNNEEILSEYCEQSSYVSVMEVERPPKKEEVSFFDLLINSAMFR